MSFFRWKKLSIHFRKTNTSPEIEFNELGLCLKVLKLDFKQKKKSRNRKFLLILNVKLIQGIPFS